MNHLEKREWNVLFTESLKLTGVKEYGISWEKFVSGEVDLPPEGARFDIAFAGTLTGEKLTGKVEGVDYLTVRGDGRFQLNLFATIETQDGANISFTEQATLTPNPAGASPIQLDIRFHTAHAKYTWLNKIHAWGVGDVFFSDQSAEVTVFTI